MWGPIAASRCQSVRPLISATQSESVNEPHHRTESVLMIYETPGSPVEVSVSRAIRLIASEMQ